MLQPVARPQIKDFRLYLQNEFISRCKNNSRYSLRAFARSLEIDSSSLSRLLNGKRMISKTMHVDLGEKLGLAPHEIKNFESFNNSKRKKIDDSLSGLNHYQHMTLDTFEIISDWYHYAILELTKLKHFKGDPRWIAQTLNLSISAVHIAIERLERTGLLHIKKGRWKLKNPSNTVTGYTFTTAAAKQLQKQVCQMSLQALEEIPFQYRNHSSMTMAIDSRQLSLAKSYIQDFRRKLSHLLQRSKKLDHVYQLGVSFYPLTQIKKNRSGGFYE